MAVAASGGQRSLEPFARARVKNIMTLKGLIQATDSMSVAR